MHIATAVAVLLVVPVPAVAVAVVRAAAGAPARAARLSSFMLMRSISSATCVGERARKQEAAAGLAFYLASSGPGADLWLGEAPHRDEDEEDVRDDKFLIFVTEASPEAIMIRAEVTMVAAAISEWTLGVFSSVWPRSLTSCWSSVTSFWNEARPSRTMSSLGSASRTPSRPRPGAGRPVCRSPKTATISSATAPVHESF